MWLLRAFSALSTVVGRIYYRVRVAGDPIPRSGPVLLVANHPNFMFDAILICAAARRPVRFLAKAALLTHPLSGWLMRAVGAIPVYRRSDDPTLMERNGDMFRAASTALSQGAAVGIFPEGTCQREPHLAPLKTGAARMALGTFAKCREFFPIIPVGLVLEQRTAFRSRALVVRGQPVAWDDLAPRGVDDHEAVRELTARIDAALHHVTLNLERAEDASLVQCAEGIWSAGWAANHDPASHVQRLEVATTLLAQLRRDAAGRWSPLVQQLSAHAQQLEQLGLRPASLAADSRLPAAVRWAARRCYLVTPLAVLLAVAGFLLFLVPCVLTGFATRVVRPPERKRSTATLFVGAAVSALWILILAGAVLWSWGPPPAMASLVAIPLVSVMGLAICERWLDAWRDARWFFLLRLRRRLIRKLRARQRELAVQLQELYEAWASLPATLTAAGWEPSLTSSGASLADLPIPTAADGVARFAPAHAATDARSARSVLTGGQRGVW